MESKFVVQDAKDKQNYEISIVPDLHGFTVVREGTPILVCDCSEGELTFYKTNEFGDVPNGTEKLVIKCDN